MHGKMFRKVYGELGYWCHGWGCQLFSTLAVPRKRGGSLLVAVNRDFIFLDLEVRTMNYLNMFIKLHVSALLLKKECFQFLIYIIFWFCFAKYLPCSMLLHKNFEKSDFSSKNYSMCWKIAPLLYQISSRESVFYFIPTEIYMYTAKCTYNKALHIWSLRKLVSFVFPRVLMFPSMSSQETSGLLGKQS